MEHVDPLLREVPDADLLNVPVTAVDVFVTSKEVSGKTLRELADPPPLRAPRRSSAEDHAQHGRDAHSAGHRGAARRYPDDYGQRPQRGERAVKALGVADRPLESTDLLTVAAGILAGALGAITVNWGGIPIGLSTSGGALLAGLVLDYLRAIRPTVRAAFPRPPLVLMNTLNVFIAIVGINAGPGVHGGAPGSRAQPLRVGDWRRRSRW